MGKNKTKTIKKPSPVGKVAPVRVTDEVADFCEKHLIHRCAVPLPLKGKA